jgi:hypothetical protein
MMCTNVGGSVGAQKLPFRLVSSVVRTRRKKTFLLLYENCWRNYIFFRGITPGNLFIAFCCVFQGHDTSTVTVGWTLFALSNYPEYQVINIDGRNELEVKLINRGGVVTNDECRFGSGISDQE